MNQRLRITSLGLLLMLSFVGAVLSTEGRALGHSPQCLSITRERPVEYDLSAMREALAELTHWHVTDWPEPQIQELLPDVFQDRTELDHHRFVGDYDPGKNRVFINLTCRCQVPDHPEAFCQAVLFHELVHWGQHQLGIDRGLSWSEQERQAANYENQYLEIRLGVLDVDPPARPTLSELPPLVKPVRLTLLQPRTSVLDAAGQPQALWIFTGRWMDASTSREYQGQAIAHRGHWVGVEIFEVNPSSGQPQLVEAWWDLGYLRHDTAFPAHPLYQGRWVQVK